MLNIFKNIGVTELVVLLVVVLLVFGGKKLPELGKGLGDAYRELKKGLTGKK